MLAAMMRLITFAGPVWRLMAAHLVHQPAAPAVASEGRFHHSGQAAVYASLSPEGASVAVRRYLTDGISRLLVPLWLCANVVADARGDGSASIIWQDQRAAGEASSTWAISDAARHAGAQALLYSSRSRPDLSHVVVFATACLAAVGPPEPMRKL